jgi:hypothetical protein
MTPTLATLPNFNKDGLRIEIKTLTPIQIKIRIVSYIDNHQQGIPEDYLSAVHALCLKEKIQEVIVDISELKRLRSIDIKVLAKWIFQIKNQNAPPLYSLHFIYDSTRSSQEVSLVSLQDFGSDFITVEKWQSQNSRSFI